MDFFQLGFQIFIFIVSAAGFADRFLDCSNHQLRNKRIVGGERESIIKYPWIAALRQDPSFMSCGASLIHKCFVITAAHCFKLQPNAKPLITFGTDKKEFEVYRTATKMIRHPNYDRNHTHDDIMLIKLDQPVKFTPEIQPICLPNLYQDMQAMTARVLGFGEISYHGEIDGRLRSVKLNLIPNEKCTEIFNTTLIRPTNICAGGEEGKDACLGDSGAPLVIRRNDNYHIIGVVSWGVKCAKKGIPGVYTRISSYIDWIYDVIEKENC